MRPVSFTDSELKAAPRKEASPFRTSSKGIPPAELVFFLFWPFGALLRALGKYKEPWAKPLFLLFCIYFGFVFVYDDPFGITGSDSARYARQLIEASHERTTFLSMTDTFYNPDTGEVDVYRGMIVWFVSRLTDDPRVLFCVLALVFGYFFVQNIWLLFGKIQRRVSVPLFIILLAFGLNNPIWNINGVRMWTAAQVFVFGILTLVLQRDGRGYFWLGMSFLVHFSFLFPIVIFLVFRIIPKSVWIFFVFFVTTGLVQEINLLFVRDSLSFMPGVFQQRIEGYTQQEDIDDYRESSSRSRWHLKWARFSIRAACWLISIALMLSLRRWMNAEPLVFGLFRFTLFFGGWTNLASLVPSGWRFQTVFVALLLACLVQLLGKKRPLIPKGLVVSTAVYLFLGYYCVFRLRVGLEYSSWMTFFGNPILAYFIEEPTPLIEIIKRAFS